MRFRLPFTNLDPDARMFGIGYLLLLPLYLAPLFAARFLPGLDLPFHLAMVDMLKKVGEPGSPYAPYYEGGFALAPYALHYLALRVLSAVLPLMLAHKVVVALYVASFPLATAFLLNACARSRLPALLAFPLAYNLTLHYGFVSFALSLPVLMALLACLARFLTTDRMKAGSPGRYAGLGCNIGLGLATAVAAVALFLCHLQNFLFGVCAAAAFIVFVKSDWRRRLIAAATFVPALAFLVRWHLSNDFAVPGSAQRRSLLYILELVWTKRRADMGNTAWLDDLWARMVYLPIHLLRGFTDQIDVVVGHGILLVLAGYVVLGLIGLLERKVEPDRPRLRTAGYIACAGAVFAYLIFPHHLPEYELMTFHPRFAVLAVAMALLLVPASLRRLSGAARPLLIIPAAVVSLYWGIELFRHYRLYDKEVADFDAVVSKTPPGGRALGLVFDRHSRVMRIESALVGLPSLYPVLRPSPTALVPIFYCGMRHMPCRRLTPQKPMPDLSPWGPTGLQPDRAIDFFDYFFIRLPPNRPIFGQSLKRLELIASQGSWLVYRRRPGPPPPAADPVPAPAPAPKARRDLPRRAGR
jgi:hypothetical protein